MKAVFFLLACLIAFSAASYPVRGSIWNNCGTSTDLFAIQNVDIIPNPPKAGDAVNVTISGSLKETITEGSLHIKVKYGFLTVLKTEKSICHFEKCPIIAGPWSQSADATIPKSAPKGHYTAEVKGTNQNNEEIFCVEVDMHLS
eukprot:GCRY01000162.1.p2 GENE.GCRY01000162.1~~GCRY01000162.1.p2  ORF type:complete len:166 (+),score=27.97 GCRY01000162.1:67-498(+)